MSIVQLCFQSPGKFSELVPENPAANKELIIDLLKQSVREFPFHATIRRLRIHYLYPENQYTICIDFWVATDAEEAELLVEGLVVKALLQLFSEMSFVDGPYS